MINALICFLFFVLGYVLGLAAGGDHSDEPPLL